jgi:hypothetical protein
MEDTGQLERVVHDEGVAVRAEQDAMVTHLAAGLCVERRRLEDDQGGLARSDTLYGLSVAHQRAHVQTIGIECFVTEEFRRLERGDELGRQHGGSGELARCTRGFPLLLHRGLEAGHVHRQAAFARDVAG